MLFFWAHWCGDCKAEAPIITQLRSEFASKGLKVIGPTRLYGYTAQIEHARPSDELQYIDAVRHRFYSGLLDMPVPISKYNFEVYGASTTPTLVLLDRTGKVAMYHPGALPYDAVEGGDREGGAVSARDSSRIGMWAQPRRLPHLVYFTSFSLPVFTS